MSYHLLSPRDLGLPAEPAPYPLYPLAVVEPLPASIPLTPLPRPRVDRRKLIVAIVLAVLLIAFLLWLERQLENA